MLAAVGCGIFKDVKEAAEKRVKVVDTVEPELADNKYQERYEKFRQIYPTVRELYRSLNQSASEK